MREFMIRTSQRPRPLPAGRWNAAQRWSDVLYAHWPVAAASVESMIPAGLKPDLFNGAAWLGIVPHRAEGLRRRGLPQIIGTGHSLRLGLRLCVREERGGERGICFLSMEASNLMTVAVARLLSGWPYHWAEMRLEQLNDRDYAIYSRRMFGSPSVIFKARYRSLGMSRRLVETRPGSLEAFLAERNFFYCRNRAGETVRSSFHCVASPLEEAEALIEQNDLTAALGITLLGKEPVLHYGRRLAVYLWPAQPLVPALALQPQGPISVAPARSS